MKKNSTILLSLLLLSATFYLSACEDYIIPVSINSAFNSSPVAFGEMWFHNDTSGTVFNITSNSTYFKVNIFDGGQGGTYLNKVTYANSTLFIQQEDDYKIVYSVSYQMTSNHKTHVVVFLNDSVQLMCTETHTKGLGSTNIYSATGVCIQHLFSGTNVSLYFLDENFPATSITFYSASLAVNDLEGIAANNSLTNNLTGWGRPNYVPVFNPNETNLNDSASPYPNTASSLYWTNPGYGDLNFAELVMDTGTDLTAGDFHLLRPSSCLMFNDMTRQCTAATSTPQNVTGWGNATYPTMWVNSSNLTIVNCPLGQSYRKSLSTIGWECYTPATDTDTRSNDYFFFNGAKITANGTTTYFLLGGSMPLSATMQINSSFTAQCDLAEYGFNVQAYTTPATINYTIIKNGAVDKWFAKTITANGDYALHINNIGFKPAEDLNWAAAYIKMNGTAQFSNTWIMLHCRQTII